MMAKKNNKHDVHEIRRFCLRSPTDLSPYLDGLRFDARLGGEYVLRPDDYDRGIDRLEKAGLHVNSVQEMTYELGNIPYCDVTGRRWGYSVDDPDQWSYISMVTRRWRRCRVDQEGRILLRRGMALADHSTGGRPKYYLIPGDAWFDHDFHLQEYKVRGSEAIRGAYCHVMGTLPVPFWDDESGLLFGTWPNYVIPKEHEEFLSKTLNPLDEPLDNTGWETFWVWHPHDRELVQRTLEKLRLRLAPWDAGEDWVNITSLILKRSYGTYLRRKDGGTEFASIIRQKAWEEIQDPILGKLISKLISLEYEGNGAAHAFMRFLADRLPVIMNYRDLGNSLTGWVIESSPVFYLDRKLDKRYYRLILPDFDIVTGWETNRHPDWEGDDRPRVKIYQWQNAPYIGRMKTMSRAPEPEPEKTSRRLRDKALRAIAGIPSVEWDLVKERAMGAFMLDLDGTNWKGCNDLCRYFSGYGEILRRNPAECEGLGLLLKDAFGKIFALETEEIPSSLIPDNGDWVYFIGRSSLLHHQECLRLERDIPIFFQARDRIFRRAYKSHALNASILAWIKYNWGLSRDQVAGPFSANWSENEVMEAIKELVNDDQVVLVRGKYYYRYSPLSAEALTDYINTGENDFLNSTKSLQHPLYVRSLRIDEDSLADELKRFTVSRKIVVKSSITDIQLHQSIEDAFEKLGWFGLIAAGQQINRVKIVIKRYAKEHPDLNVFRKDGEYRFVSGDSAPSVEYVCWSPLKEMAIRFG